MSLLRLTGVTAAYGPSQALFGVNLDVAEGEAVALMGRNGMGKTTTVRVICRLLNATGGQVLFCGESVAGWSSSRMARAGIGLVPEGRRIFRNLSVRENLIAAARPGAWDEARVIDLFPRLGERAAQAGGTLSGGEQQMLAIGRALMTNPRLLVLDEATEGLAPVIRQEIWAAIRQLKADTGLAFLIIDKSVQELRSVAERTVILERGSTVWEGGFAELDEGVAQRYLGL
ncbi:ABC transporter ATP-binding protein [Ovoidimarina sediminis]|uniref:ABC transporter ATP-binding protein n=1 Tax=Ovoidimarina sediminis TaxID=3079856 RepID=UPI002907AFB3|nr:ABC transporter ATP-binding protein [Rhodophyticola sp. MJ-SS7]MDU8945239.1 ABC transporter ATP-binding protein [Rhodophyticola sp. MJ-SS7]